MYSCADKVTSSAETLDISAMDFKSKPMNKEIEYIIMEGQG